MEIHWHHPESFRAADREAAEERLRALAEGRTDLIDVRIAARPTGHHRLGGHEVRINCKARGKEIVAVRGRAELAIALNETLDAFEREVWRMRHRRTQERSPRLVAPPELGVVDEIFPGEGYGFILTDGGDRVYFHRNAVRGDLDFDALADGQRVSLNFEKGDEGLQATVVATPPPGAPVP
jgi:cold shock CspA family protein/ribosome-associated translation inhibitor RaiA